MNADLKDLRGNTRRGVFWGSGGKIAAQIIQFSVGIVLARLLSPKEFGLVGMILVFTGFANLFGDLGFGAALIRKQEERQEDYASVFWINTAFGLALTLLFIGLAPLFGWFYDEPMLVPITIAISVNFLIGSFAIVPGMLLRKRMDFKALATREVGSLVVSAPIAILLALNGAGVWSLVVQALVAACGRTAFIWWHAGWKPTLVFDRGAIREMRSFSNNVLGFSLVNYWLRHGDDLLIAKFLGASALGVYSRCYFIMLLPLTNISRTISQVLFPAFALIQQDVPRVARGYLRATQSIACITFPLMVGLWLVADHFVLAFYGAKWAEMIPILAIFSWVGALQSISALNGTLYLSQGRARLQLAVGAAFGLLGLISIAIGLQWGILGVAWCYGLFSALIFIPGLNIAVQLVGLNAGHVLHNLRWVAISTAVMAAAVTGVDRIVPTAASHWIHLGVAATVGGVVYCMCLSLFKVEPWLEMFEMVRNSRYLRSAASI